jgi:hypothetical protein
VTEQIISNPYIKQQSKKIFMMIKKRKIKLSEAWKKVDFKKPSTWMLIFSNIIVIFFAIIDNLNAIEVLWIYWIQSVIIGVFNFIRILSLKEFSTVGLRRGAGGELPATKAAKISTAIFFLIHYGFFHFVYAMFLGGFSGITKASSQNSGISYLFYTSLIFFISYLIEYLQSFRNPTEEIPNLGSVMFTPYFRIIPMHMTIIFGGFLSMLGAIFSMNIDLVIIVLFVGIKTYVELITNAVDLFSFSGQLANEKADS